MDGNTRRTVWCELESMGCTSGVGPELGLVFLQGWISVVEEVQIENVVMVCPAESDGMPPVGAIVVMKKEDGGDAE
jgi:hypothetical protein